MTVASTTLRSPIVQANGVTRNWAFDFFWYEVSTLYFYVRADGVDTLIAPENYTLTPGPGNDRDGFAGGTITYPIAPAPVLTTGEIYITRLLPLNQETVDLGNSSGFSPRVVERAFDEIVMQMQQIAAGQVETGVVLTPNRDDVFVLPSPASNRIIGWNGTATALENKLTGAAIGVDEEGRVTQVSGTALITPAGGVAARTLATKLGDVLTSDDSPVATLAEVAYAQRALIKVAAGETVKLPCNPDVDDMIDMCNWISAGHIVEGDGELFLEVINGRHDVTGFCPVGRGRYLDIRGTASPTLIEITGVEYLDLGATSLGPGMYRATVTLATALPAHITAGWAIGITPVVSAGITHPCSGGHQLLTIATDRLSFTYNFRAAGTVGDIVDTGVMTAGTSFGTTNNRVVLPTFTIRLLGGWVGASNEGFYRMENGGQLHTKWCGFSYIGEDDVNREMLYTISGGRWNNSDYSVFVNAPKRIYRSGQGGSAYLNRAYMGNPAGDECVQILSANLTMVRCLTSGGTVAGISFLASSTGENSSSCAVGSPIGLRTTGAGAMLRWDSGYVGWCDDGTSASAGEISFNSSACIIERCTDPMKFLSSAYPKWITGTHVMQNNTNAAYTPGVLINGGRYINGSMPWEPSIIYDATVPAVDFPALGTEGAWTTPTTINSVATSVVSVPGALTTDLAILRRSISAPPNGVMFVAAILSDGEVTLYAANMLGANTNPTAIPMLLTVTRSR